MNLKIIGIAVGVIQILVAVWYFDWNSTNQMLISGALGLGGVGTLLFETESAKLHRIGRYLVRVGAAIAIILFLKVIIFD